MSRLPDFFETEENDVSKKVRKSLKTLHISCGLNCLGVGRSVEDFVGLCIFHPDGDKVLEDAGNT